jgi:hypothetical protein
LAAACSQKNAAEIAVRSVAACPHNHIGSVQLVKLVPFSEKDHRVYQKHVEKITADSAAVADG